MTHEAQNKTVVFRSVRSTFASHLSTLCWQRVTSHSNEGTMPDHSHFLLAYSTVNHYVSYRNELDGSRFVCCLVEVFQEKTGHGDVLSMLIMVNDKLRKMGDIGKKQIGQPITTLTKSCFFGLDCTRKHFTWTANPAMLSYCTYPMFTIILPGSLSVQVLWFGLS